MRVVFGNIAGAAEQLRVSVGGAVRSSGKQVTERVRIMKNLLIIVCAFAVSMLSAEVYNDLGPYAADSTNDGFWDVSGHSGVAVSSGSAVAAVAVEFACIGSIDVDCDVLDACVMTIAHSAAFDADTSPVRSFILIR